jgi:hypothetical protein
MPESYRNPAGIFPSFAHFRPTATIESVSFMNIVESTSLYERWLAQRTDVLSSDLKRKHQFMAEAIFPFFRGTFYRWLQQWPKVCKQLQQAPAVLAVGDLHVENFGTWRDVEGRLAWGVNDFDKSATLPYAQDLVRLASSALLAIDEGQLEVKPRLACDQILSGYIGSLKSGGRAFVLAEQNRFLRDIAQHQLSDPRLFWDRLQAWPTVSKSRVPKEAVAALEHSMPRPAPPYRLVARESGVGSRGLPRFVAIYSLYGGLVAREAKALAPSAAAWLDGKQGRTLHITELLQKAVRTPDPTIKVEGHWLIRRIAPDSIKIRIADLPSKRNEEKMLGAMGWETGNVHLASLKTVPAIMTDLKKRKSGWLFDSAREMAVVVRKDWKSWRSNFEG